MVKGQGKRRLGAQVTSVEQPKWWQPEKHLLHGRKGILTLAKVSTGQREAAVQWFNYLTKKN